MRRPEIKNVEAAIRCYYGTGYIGNQEIREIFGCKSHDLIAEMKKAAREEEIKRNIPEVVARKVSVEVAFEVWQINVDQLVQNLQKLRKLGLA